MDCCGFLIKSYGCCYGTNKILFSAKYVQESNMFIESYGNLTESYRIRYNVEES